MERYIPQIRFKPVGEQGVKKLRDSTVLIIGCGALGSGSAELLVRAGIGTLKLVDPDIVVLSNLQRQSLFTEYDVQAERLKVMAAKSMLEKINSEVKIEVFPVKFTDTVSSQIIKDVDIILDGTDNFDSRYVINKISLKSRIPWIYTGVAGSFGMVAPMCFKNGPCFECIFPQKPECDLTCREIGIINTVVKFAVSLQVSLCIKYLIGDEIIPELFSFDLWNFYFSKIRIKRNKKCRLCK